MASYRVPHVCPNLGKDGCDRPPISLQNGRFIDVIFIPGPTIVQEVGDQWLQSIDSSSYPGFCSFAEFEFLPQRKIFGLWLWRKEPKNSPRGGGFGQELSLLRPDGSVQGHVTRIDLHQIVDKEHFHHLQQVDRSILHKA